MAGERLALHGVVVTAITQLGKLGWADELTNVLTWPYME